MKTFFIPGNVPSSKNSRVWTGRYFIASKATRNYEKASKSYYIELAPKFRKATESLSKPLKVAFKFVRGSRRVFDYVNPLQTVQDFMVKNDWIDDDNVNEILPVFEVYEYNKEKPGVYITILA